MATVYALVLAFAGLLSALSTLPADAREWRSWCGPRSGFNRDPAPPLGWHFYCDRGEGEDEKEEAPQTQASPPMKPPSATERILSTRRALEEARARAILEPSTENVTDYLALQQKALQSAATFSDAFRRTVWANPALDYTLKRPVGALAKKLWSDERRAERAAALARLGRRYGLIYLGSERCPGCRVFGPLLRAVAQNAAGFAFELALETISPVIAETMSKLRALAQWVNNQNLDSCETAQALVGAVWSKNDRASAAICAAIGTRQGIFSDYAAARHGCGADGKRHSTLAAASGALKDQTPVNVNYAWRAVQASGFLASDRDLGEFAMSVSGSVIVTAPVTDSDPSGPRVRVLEPLALDRRVTEILMEGGGDLPVYRCDTSDECLNPVLGRLTVPAARGFRNRVAELLRRLVDAVRADTAPPADALGLVNLTTLPVYRIVNTAAAYRGAVVDQEVDALAEAVALDVLQVWISDLHRTVEERAGALDVADGERLSRWREGLRRNRTALARHRHEGLARFNTALAVVEKLRLIETELRGRSLGRTPRGARLLPRRRRRPLTAARENSPCTNSSPWAAGPISSIS